MTDYNKLLKKYEKPTSSEKYSNEYQNKLNQESARKNRHLILDELLLEVPFTLKKPQITIIRTWIDDFNNEFKDFHRQSSNETIILAFIFLMRKEDYPKLDISTFTISKKYNLTKPIFELIICRLVYRLIKTMPIVLRTTNRKDHDILQKTGKQ